MAEINTNKTAESSWVVNTSWNTGRDDDGWWMSKSVANPTTYTDVKTRMLPHKDWISKDFAAEGFLIVALAALSMALWHSRKSDLLTLLTSKTKAKK